MRQPHIHHGRLIHDQKINLQRLILLVLAAKIALQAKQTVQRQRLYRLSFFAETPNQSSAAFAGSFAPILRLEKLEIHKVFLRFSSLVLCQNLSPNALAD